eukprot:TRINITY_DN4098_c0_g1_i1.p1 TRINITY_DN4098_c0_g1~~TRINITY_DN4098_c0_g1_i1.p1  ORF type:complete len:241 (-),score=36.70 TRINITY_DN4098_c0_g1_i1:277-999(-)
MALVATSAVPLDDLVGLTDEEKAEYFSLTVEDESARVNQALKEEKENQFRPGLFLDDPPEEFTVEIVRETSTVSLGLALDPSDGMSLIVKGITDGPVTATNEERKKSHSDIRLFDRITAVNGICGDSEDLLKEINRDCKVELRIARPKQYEITLTKPPDNKIIYHPSHYKHGCIVENCHGYLCILGLPEGIFKEYNRYNWQNPVRVNDRILECNGHRLAEKIIELMSDKKNRVLKLVLEH